MFVLVCLFVLSEEKTSLTKPDSKLHERLCYTTYISMKKNLSQYCKFPQTLKQQYKNYSKQLQPHEILNHRCKQTKRVCPQTTLLQNTILWSTPMPVTTITPVQYGNRAGRQSPYDPPPPSPLSDTPSMLLYHVPCPP